MWSVSLPSREPNEVRVPGDPLVRRAHILAVNLAHRLPRQRSLWQLTILRRLTCPLNQHSTCICSRTGFSAAKKIGTCFQSVEREPQQQLKTGSHGMNRRFLEIYLIHAANQSKKW